MLFSPLLLDVAVIPRVISIRLFVEIRYVVVGLCKMIIVNGLVANQTLPFSENKRVKERFLMNIYINFQGA